MRPGRRQRLAVGLFLLFGSALTIGVGLFALQENIDLFYEPQKVVGGEAPIAKRIRAGGMVEKGSLVYEPEGLGVSFVLSDLRGSRFEVRYEGLLPGLFREGQGVLVVGQLDASRVFYAKEVLAKHDENYMPPELVDMGAET
ncbi:MAG: cytochrome c maturation protein CcmE [Pseudomonadales bacterium]|nr:cytochrome c biogenesis protein CcmE [Gammaproteobacteria bacterium]MCS5569022.1 cytochrome c maturation protein CcmE [Pseudomonadales bacterium]MEC9240945.1 cytochrome c maturation protein CcmE [Pseudomonadota bacterium]|tara:strand:+ start:15845 stop:16270 length:426 start_codon:yes stop_codon:yes gene_type:complete